MPDQPTFPRRPEAATCSLLCAACNLIAVLSATEVRIMLTTVATQDEAERIARSLVRDHLAACVNLVPGLTSIYRWQGEVDTANEILLIIKTEISQVERVEAALRTLHPYEVPEFLVLQPESISKPYLDWLLSSVR